MRRPWWPTGTTTCRRPATSALWTSPAFDPQVRDGWLYARGASDDKGNYWALLRAALDLAESGSLGVNVRVIADGEEEVGGHSVIDYLATLEDDFGAAVIFDGAMVSGEAAGDDHRPARAGRISGAAGAPTARSSTRASTAARPQTRSTTWWRCWRRVAGQDQDFADGIAPVTDEERAGWAVAAVGRRADAGRRRDAGRRPRPRPTSTTAPGSGRR